MNPSIRLLSMACAALCLAPVILAGPTAADPSPLAGPLADASNGAQAIALHVVDELLAYATALGACTSRPPLEVAQCVKDTSMPNPGYVCIYPHPGLSVKPPRAGPRGSLEVDLNTGIALDSRGHPIVPAYYTVTYSISQYC